MPHWKWRRVSSHNVPQNPGLYAFESRSGSRLYIGKAKDLAKRATPSHAKYRAGNSILVLSLKNAPFRMTRQVASPRSGGKPMSFLDFVERSMIRLHRQPGCKQCHRNGTKYRQHGRTQKGSPSSPVVRFRAKTVRGRTSYTITVTKKGVMVK